MEKKLKNLRENNPSLRTQIRLGDNDLQVMVKHIKTGEYSQYIPASNMTIDPANEFPPITFKGQSLNPNDADFIAKAAAAANSKTRRTDEEGFTTVEQHTSPTRAYRLKRKRQDTPEKINNKLARLIRGETVIDDKESDMEDGEVDEEYGRTIPPRVAMPNTPGTEPDSDNGEDTNKANPVLVSTAQSEL